MALKKYDLLIMRHYLEHYVGAEEIVECISKIIERSGKKYAYIEVPDCSKFISQKNPLFLWEQHKVYFTDSVFETC